MVRPHHLALLILAGCSKKPAGAANVQIIPAPATQLTHAQAIAHPEGYSLHIDADGTATVEASTEAGRFYAEQSLRQLKGARNVELHDAPRYRWRALHFDVARHFFPASDVEHLLDLMALFKLNVFHWHLTDDQGWRLPVAGHPELTQGQDAYSADEIRHVVEYAKARHITLVPEIDMPGHMRGLLASHPELSCRGEPLPLPADWGVFKDVLCAGNPDTYALIGDVLAETAKLFPGPYLHIGGDEVPTERWGECPKCRALGPETVQAHFMAKVVAQVKALGKRPIGWDEVLDHRPPAELVVMAWTSVDAAKRAIALGHDTVLVPYQLTYLDRPESPYADDPVRCEKIAAFEPPDSPHVLGVEAALWTEYVPTLERAEQQLFPRLLAVADLAWSPQPSRAGNPLEPRLGKARDLLDSLGVASFVDPPTGLHARRAFVDGGTLELKAREGIIRYSLDGSDPTADSAIYRKPIALGATVDVAARVYSGQRSSPIARGRIVVEPFSPAVDAGVRGPGARFRYYPGAFDVLPAFEGLTPEREGESATLVPADVAKNDWALVSEGLFAAPQTKVYTFTLTTDDGARLLVDGRQIVDNDGLHPPRARTGEVALEQGLHRVRVEFFQRGGAYVLELDPGTLRIEQ